MAARAPSRSLVVASLGALAVTSAAPVARADSPDARDRTTAAPLADRPAEPERPAPREGGLLGPFQVGAYAGVSFPRPLSIEGMVTYRKLVAVGVEYSVLPEL